RPPKTAVVGARKLPIPTRAWHPDLELNVGIGGWPDRPGHAAKCGQPRKVRTVRSRIRSRRDRERGRNGRVGEGEVCQPFAGGRPGRAADGQKHDEEDATSCHSSRLVYHPAICTTLGPGLLKRGRCRVIGTN